MENNNAHTYYEILAQKWLNGSISQEEQAEFMAWYNSMDDGEPIDIPGELADTEEAHQLRLLKQIREKINRSNTRHSSWLQHRWIVAATVIMLLGAGAFFQWYRSSRTTQATLPSTYNVPPGGNKAVLTLSDGSRITLDSARQGTLASQGHTQVVKMDSGLVAYRAGGRQAKAESEVTYNTLSTPRGGQFQLLLPDGTKVWLNAISSIRFPTVFNGKERAVTVTGEVYFEVAANARQPFRVNVDNRESISVLGTRFNVNAYDDEQSLNTTLLAGKIEVSANTKSLMLQPGEQAQLGQEMQVVSNVDLDKVIAWKNGLLNFDGLKLQEVMRQLARWYDIEVVYEPGVPDIEFVGALSKDVSLADMLKGLQGAGVHFRIEAGHRLVVMP